MEIQKRKTEKCMIVSVSGRLDAVTSPDFEKEMEGCLADGETVLVVDLPGLEYISSAGLRSILAITKKLKARNGKIVLSSLQDMVKEVFEISGFSKILPIFPTKEDALSNL
jgi:anti-anti-sigma factor